MKVVICAKNFGTRGGGAEGFLRLLGRHLLARGHTVRVLTATGVAGTNPPVTVIRVGKGRLPFMADWARGKAFAESLSREDADVSFGEQKMWNCDIVRPGGGVHEEFLRQYAQFYPGWKGRVHLRRLFSLKDRVIRKTERRSFTSPTLKKVIANSRMVEDELLLHYPNLRGKSAVVYNGADVDRFTPELAVRWRRETLLAQGLDPATATAIFVGRDYRRKGLWYALQALACIRSRIGGRGVQFLVVGRGREREYRRLAARLGVLDTVRFTGDLGETERYYGASDVLLFPTLYDPCANVTLEALASGLPVITTAKNGASALLTPGADGWVLDRPDDVDGMARALSEVRDVPRLAVMKRYARACAERHPLRATMDGVTSVIEQVAELNRGRTAPSR